MQIWDRQAMISTDMKSFSSQHDRTVDDILTGTVIVLDFILIKRYPVVSKIIQIEIGSCKHFQWIAKISGNRNRLQENLRSDDRRSKIEEYTALKRANGLTENFKILTGTPTDGREVRCGMLMNNIGPYCNMNRIGNTLFPGVI